MYKTCLKCNTHNICAPLPGEPDGWCPICGAFLGDPANYRMQEGREELNKGTGLWEVA